LRRDGNWELVEFQECSCEKNTSCVLQLQWDWYNYYVTIRFQGTASEDWEPICVLRWIVKCVEKR
jgi:hypothetical protein